MGRPVLGSPEIIRAMSRQSVVAYLKDHYGASRMVLSAAGNLEHDEIVALADKLLSGMPSERAISTEAARYVGGDHRQDRDLEQLHLVLGFPGLPLGDPDYYAAAVLSTAFGGGMSSRLFQEVREKREELCLRGQFLCLRLSRPAGFSASMPGAPARMRQPNCCRCCATRP